MVLASTPSHLYKFTETVRPDVQSPFQSIFKASTLDTADKSTFQRISSTSSPSSASTKLLRLCYDPPSHFARSFALLTATDLHYTQLSDNSTMDIVPLPTPTQSSPLAFSLTDHHALLAYSDRLIAISLLNYAVVYEEYFSERFGSLVDVVRDTQTGAHYVYTTKTIFRLKVTNERRDVWRIYMDLGRLDRALQFAGDNPRNKDIVLSRTAEMKFNSGLYSEAAAIYAETMTSFETVSLKFLELGQVEALRMFLRRKLVTLPAGDFTQITMLVVWLVELYLTEIAKQRSNHNNRVGDAATVTLQREFDEFMRLDRVVECTAKNATVLHDLMASHGDCHNLAALAAVNRDFEATIGQLLQAGKWSEGLQVLRRERRPELFYRFAPILMEAVPKETVAALIEQRDNLTAGKLLPTLISCRAEQVREVIQYLEFAIHSLGTQEMAVHNYLIRLLAQHAPEKLRTYLETQGQDVTQLPYDRQFALRVCFEFACDEASVFLQGLLGLWSEAVELALRGDNVALAQETANRPGDVEVRRKLWLRIARAQIQGKGGHQVVDVEGALRLLKTCDLLRIEDLLPFFDDFERIDDVKGAICEALQEYNVRIQEQKKDMAEAERAAERVRGELQRFRERALTISGDDLCGSCATLVLQRACFVFPCGHKLHADCLERELVQLLGKGGGGGGEAVRLSVLKQRMMTAEEGSKEWARCRGEYEEMLAGECVYCGQLMIEAIDQPFVEDWERGERDWA